MLREQTFEGRHENLNQANKLSRTYAVLLDALNRHRLSRTYAVLLDALKPPPGQRPAKGDGRACQRACCDLLPVFWTEDCWKIPV